MTFWVQLAIDTLRDPKGTAERIMAWNLDRTTLYMALLAVAAVNALLASAPIILSPGEVDAELMAALPILSIMQRPIMFFMLVAGSLVLMVHGMYWVGRAMGGKGSLLDILAVLTWLQALRAAAQIGILVLGFAVPALAGLVALGVLVVAMWLLLHFISAAMRFDSLLVAFGLLIGVVAGLFVGLMLIITITGVSTGGLANV